MKTRNLLFILTFTLSCNVSAQFSWMGYKNKQISLFKESKTLFILYGDSNSQNELKRIVQKVWTITPYGFVNVSEIDKYEGKGNYSICEVSSYTSSGSVTSPGTTVRTGPPASYNMGVQQYSTIQQPKTSTFNFSYFYYGIKMLEKKNLFTAAINPYLDKTIAFSWMDMYGTEQTFDHMLYRLEASLVQIQNTVPLIENNKLGKHSMAEIKEIYNKQLPLLANKTLLINDKYVNKHNKRALLEEKDIQKNYPFTFRIVSENEIMKAIEQRDSTTAFLLQGTDVTITETEKLTVIYSASKNKTSWFFDEDDFNVLRKSIKKYTKKPRNN